MLEKIVFPLSHQVYKSGPIKEEEQRELSSTLNVPVDRIHAELQTLKGLIESGKHDAPRSMVRLRRMIKSHLESTLATKQETVRMRIKQFGELPDARYAVFMRSQSGQAAKFRALHTNLDSAIEVARTHAAESAGRGYEDFTYYAIEIKHRVGIEHGKLVDEPMK